MFRDLLSSRLIQAGLVFFVLVVGGSLLFSWHVDRVTDREMARHDHFLKGREKQNESHPAPVVPVPSESENPGLVNTPNETWDTHKPDETEALPNAVVDRADMFVPDDFVSAEEAPAADVPVSPHGFGPYPEVPEELPLMESRTVFSWTGKNVEDELVMRVMIKAWNEGERGFYGAYMVDGKVLLHVPNTAYFRYREKTNDDGSVVQIRVIASHPHIELRAMPGARVVHFDDAAIDPYEYLDLP